MGSKILEGEDNIQTIRFNVGTRVLDSFNSCDFGITDNLSDFPD